MNNTLVLLDVITRKSGSFIDFEGISKVAEIISSIDEISPLYKGYNLIIFEPAGFSCADIPTLERLKELHRLNIILASSCDESVIHLASLITIVICDISHIDATLVQCLASGDLNTLKDYQEIIPNIQIAQQTLAHLPAEVAPIFQTLSNNLQRVATSINDLITTNHEQSIIVEGLQASNHEMQNEVNRLQVSGKEDKIKLHEYETLLTAQYLKTIDISYPDKPVIIYLKQYQAIPGIEVFIRTLYNVLTLQRKCSCKVLKLIDSNNALVRHFIPDDYLCMTNTYNTSEVLNGDFLLKSGAYDLLLDTLLSNKARLNYLVIHDCRGCISNTLSERLINVFLNICTSDYASYFMEDNILTESPKSSKLYWKMGSATPIQLMNHPTIQEILGRC